MVYLDSNKFKVITIAFLGLLLFSSCHNVDNYLLSTNKTVSLQLDNGKFVTANRDKGNVLFSDGAAAYEWETFKLISTEEDLVYIKTSLGQFVSYNNVDSILIGDSESPGKTETFVLIPSDGKYQLQSLSGGNVIVNEQNQLAVSYQFSAEKIKIKKVIKYPSSWFALEAVHKLPFVVQFLAFVVVMLLFFRKFKTLIKKNRISYYTVLILGFILLYVILNTKQWQRDNVIVSDGIVYYEYLPAAFIFNDLSFNFTNNLPADFDGTIWIETNKETGVKLPKTSLGLSYMYMPFFFLGHITANFTGFTTYGYSEPYGLFLCIGIWFYVFLSLFYLRKILLFYFSDAVTTLTLISILLATNLFYYTTIASTMSHGYSFCLFVFFIYHTIKWHQTKSWKTALFLGIIAGLISIIRPTNALIAIVFILFNVFSLESLKAKIILFWKYRVQILVLIVAALLVWSPQIAYWKYFTGHYFYFSYGEERFYFNNPHILDGLFSYRKGWLLYTPIMVFAVLGIGFLFKFKKEWALAISIFTALNIYVAYSWWCWWYGGSFGSRPMVESYALMAIPLAMFYNWLEQKHHLLRYVSIFIIVLATALNLFQTQQTKTCLHWDGMTKEAYWSNFTKWGYPEGVDDMIKSPDYEKAVKGIEEYN